ncbi:MAG: enoyl-ACP reductase [Alphaproteobacteria bacterium]|jgi:enoyl-[acyl-carrier protein] reductase I|nr:enoyl-ACP reductase [Alphaproteobacteria bacterium]
MTEAGSKTGLMAGKRGVIMGVANDHSLAWGITKSLAAQGAEIAFTFQSEVLEKRVRPLAQSLGFDCVIPCDVGKEGDIARTFSALKEKWGTIDFVVHAIAYADKEELKGKYADTSRRNFLNSLDISCYSFTETCREASKLMPDGGALITLTYHGAQRVMPHYNVMGVAKAALEASVRYLAVDLGGQNIRVNAISAGPVKTLAASGIGDFRYILQWNQYNAPLKRNTTLEDVGGAGVYLLSNLSSGVTGEIHYVDSGYHVVGMKAVDAPDIATV